MISRAVAQRPRFQFVIRHHPLRRVPAFVIMFLLVACGSPASATGSKAASPGPFHAAQATPTTHAPSNLPAEESPHEHLPEWWYYTGHRRTHAGADYGF